MPAQLSSHISVDELRSIAQAALGNSRIPEAVAAVVVEALLLAELDGIPSHGLARLPFYADQAISGKIQAWVKPEVTHPRPAVVLVDAGYGFAFPAIEAGLEAAYGRVAQEGLCSVAVRRSHHCGVLGHFVEQIAKRGFVGFACANTPAAIAPWGGSRGVFGTNPLAFACPRAHAEPIVMDLSLSAVARGKIMLAGQRAEKIPPGWALDAEGRETTDPEAALQGTMQPLGGAKGAALALMVELLAATLSGANHASEASSFFEAQGAPPGVGQFFLLLDPAAFNPSFLNRVEALCADILVQGNTRLPGARRQELRSQRAGQGIAIPDALLAELRRRAGGPG